MLSEVTVHQFCVTGDIDRSIATVRAALAERAALLAAALRREIPGATSSSPTAGTSSGSTCPTTWTSDKLVPAAAGAGVAVVKGSDFLLEGGRHSLRLAYSAVHTDQVDEGVRRLAAAVAGRRAARLSRQIPTKRRIVVGTG